MQQGNGPAARDGATLIAPLRQGVLAWMDADRVLPADGSCLLAMLERALGGVAGENTAAARAGIEAFIDRVQALIETGLLEPAEAHPRITAAATVAVLLRNAGESDG
jgi:hypothetical protein